MTGKHWTAHEIEILQENYAEVSYGQLENLLPGKTAGSIKNKASGLGLYKQEPWSADEDELLRKLYPAATQIEITSNIPGHTWEACKLHAGILGVKRPRQHYNRDKPYHYFFDVIDTPEKAYVLGFFVADGNVQIDKDRYVVVFSNNDKTILEKIRCIMGADVDVKPCSANRPDQYALQIGSKKLAYALRDLGFDNHKSSTAKMPSIKPELHSHFARGLFDGDGSVTRRVDGNKEYPILHFNGTEELLIEIAKILPVDVPSVYIGNPCRITLSFKKARTVLDWMYNDANGLYIAYKCDRYQALKYGKYI